MAISKAIKLLANTDLDVDIIQHVTGCTFCKINDLARTHRPLPYEQLPEESEVIIMAEAIVGQRYKGAIIQAEEEIKAIRFLEDTELSYREIEKATGVSYARIAYFGPKIRSEEMRARIKSAQGRKYAQIQREKLAEEAQAPAIKPAADTPSESTSIVERKMTFNVSINGKEVSKAEFFKELDGVRRLVEQNGSSESVNFKFEIETK